MVFENEFVPDDKQAIKSILDYQITIKDLKPEETHYLALGMNYSVAGFEMILQRKMSFYIVTYYLPSGLFVVVSWISFLVNPEVIPGRMTLLVTIFLVLINIFNTIQTNSPKAEGLTGMYFVVMSPSRAGSSHSSSWGIFSSAQLGSWLFSLQLGIENWPKTSSTLSWRPIFYDKLVKMAKLCINIKLFNSKKHFLCYINWNKWSWNQNTGVKLARFQLENWSAPAPLGTFIARARSRAGKTRLGLISSTLVFLFWPTVRKNWSSDREKLLKFEAEGREFANILRSLEQFIQTVKGQNNFW